MFFNLFDPTIVDLKKDPSFFIDIKEQVIQVCNDFGKVEKVFVEQRSEGRVWVKYSENDLKGAKATLEALNYQKFDDREIRVSFITESAFANKCKER